MDTLQMKERILKLESALFNIYIRRKRDSIYGDLLPELPVDSDNFEDFIDEMESY